jgi:hypothetical protein
MRHLPCESISQWVPPSLILFKILCTSDGEVRKDAFSIVHFLSPFLFLLFPTLSILIIHLQVHLSPLRCIYHNIRVSSIVINIDFTNNLCYTDCSASVLEAFRQYVPWKYTPSNVACSAGWLSDRKVALTQVAGSTSVTRR